MNFLYFTTNSEDSGKKTKSQPKSIRDRKHQDWHATFHPELQGRVCFTSRSGNKYIWQGYILWEMLRFGLNFLLPRKYLYEYLHTSCPDLALKRCCGKTHVWRTKPVMRKGILQPTENQSSVSNILSFVRWVTLLISSFGPIF